MLAGLAAADRRVVAYLAKMPGLLVAYDLIAQAAGLDGTAVFRSLERLIDLGLVEQHSGCHPNYGLSAAGQRAWEEYNRGQTAHGQAAAPPRPD